MIIYILLSISVLFNIALFLISKAQFLRAEAFEKMIIRFGNNAQSAYETIKEIDDKQMFEKDDEVGSVFQQMVDIIEDFNKKTHQE